ncbi:response regulator [Candidatus Parcubacteria bacterium]|nr:response regulator [Candidatus Parcubacteria bacterium]
MPGRILMVEPDAFWAELLTRRFEELGYEVDLAGDWQSALTFMGGSTPAAIVLDAAVGPVATSTLLHAIRSLPAAGVAGVVMLGHAGSPDERSQAARFGVERYVPKMSATPIEIVALATALAARREFKRA